MWADAAESYLGARQAGILSRLFTGCTGQPRNGRRLAASNRRPEKSVRYVRVVNISFRARTSYSADSQTVAIPWPTPMHMVARP